MLAALGAVMLNDGAMTLIVTVPVSESPPSDAVSVNVPTPAVDPVE
jgi:hypothetical protein